jgi:menaquinone-9 beta-reductase
MGRGNRTEPRRRTRGSSRRLTLQYLIETTMEQADVLIVGGGPAGSTCAARLRDGGLDPLVLDKAQFPRTKPCAGWITPLVLEELGLSADQYREHRTLQPMTGFRIGRIGTPGRAVSTGKPLGYGIRRSEFDDYLLHRSGARLCLGESVRTIRRAGRQWIVNERFEAPMLVAAGGHFCPVARLLAGTVPIFAPAKMGLSPSGSERRSSTGKRGQVPFVQSTLRAVPTNGTCPLFPEQGALIVSQEVELELTEAQQADCPVRPEVPELYFCNDLLGYGWCIRKGNYLNVGLGRADRQNVPRHVAEFCEFLRRQGRLSVPLDGKFLGHAYLLYEQSTRRLVDDGLVWIGDSAGLAYSESGEGIRPAVESALFAADAIIAARGNYRAECLEPYRLQLQSRLGRRTARPKPEGPPSLMRQLAGRWLLGQPWFLRHVLLDRWFLHARDKAVRQAASKSRSQARSSRNP